MMQKLYCAVLMVLGLSGFAATTYTYTDGGLVWTYTLKASQATLSGVIGSPLDGELVIPSSVTNGADEASYPVVVIGANCFQGMTITGLKIADSVTTIGAGAFANCTALKTVALGNGLTTIGDATSSWYDYDYDPAADSGAFGGCLNLETVTFGENLLHIGNHAFTECQNLKTLVC